MGQNKDATTKIRILSILLTKKEECDAILKDFEIVFKKNPHWGLKFSQSCFRAASLNDTINRVSYEIEKQNIDLDTIVRGLEDKLKGLFSDVLVNQSSCVVNNYQIICDLAATNDVLKYIKDAMKGEI